ENAEKIGLVAAMLPRLNRWYWWRGSLWEEFHAGYRRLEKAAVAQMDAVERFLTLSISGCLTERTEAVTEWPWNVDRVGDLLNLAGKARGSRRQPISSRCARDKPHGDNGRNDENAVAVGIPRPQRCGIASSVDSDQAALILIRIPLFRM